MSEMLQFLSQIMSIRILLLGNGGREHALAWKLAQSSLVEHIYVCPGNAGTKLEPKTTNLSDISPSDFPSLVDFAVKNNVSQRIVRLTSLV